MDRFVIDDKRGRQETRAMIMNMAKYGNHNYHFERPFNTDEDVEAFFHEQGLDLKQLVEICRQKDESVARVENLFTSIFSEFRKKNSNLVHLGDTPVPLVGYAAIVTWKRVPRGGTGPLPLAMGEEGIMRDQMQARLKVLKQEFEAGETELEKVEKQRAYLRETLLSIGGAIQVLEELLAGEPSVEPPNGATGPGGTQVSSAPASEDNIVRSR
jgi:hypothetical protein